MGEGIMDVDTIIEKIQDHLEEMVATSLVSHEEKLRKNKIDLSIDTEIRFLDEALGMLAILRIILEN
jgi:hypothetical protein